MSILVPVRPGDPRYTTYIKKIEFQSGIVYQSGKSTTVYVTAEMWGRIAAEIEAQYSDMLLDPDRPMPRNKGAALVFGALDPKLTVANSGTDDQRQVARMNRGQPGADEFQNILRRVATAPWAEHHA